MQMLAVCAHYASAMGCRSDENWKMDLRWKGQFDNLNSEHFCCIAVYLIQTLAKYNWLTNVVSFISLTVISSILQLIKDIINVGDIISKKDNLIQQ